MTEDGTYLINIIDDYAGGRYMPSVIHTLKHTFDHTYLFGTPSGWENAGRGTFIIIATDQKIDLTEYQSFITQGGKEQAVGIALDETMLEHYLVWREPVLLTDNYAPTDILALTTIDE